MGLTFNNPNNLQQMLDKFAAQLTVKLDPGPLNEARDGTCLLMDTSQVLNLMSQNEDSLNSTLKLLGIFRK